MVDGARVLGWLPPRKLREGALTDSRPSTPASADSLSTQRGRSVYVQPSRSEFEGV